MKAHLVQLDITWEDPSANHAAARHLIETAAPEPGDLIILPELFATGFSMNTSRTLDAAGATHAFLQTLARDLGVLVQGGRTIAGARLARNVMTVASPAGTIAEYAKVHPFSLGREHEHFEAGSEVVTYPWGPAAAGLAVCPAICYDLRFPELFRLGLARGAEVFALGACWPEVRQHHWRALLIARAIENQAYVLGVNRTGSDPSLRYAGGTIAVSPTGEVLGELAAEQGVLSVEVDPGAVRRWREKFPAWRDRRLP